MMTVVISVLGLAFVLSVSGCGLYHRPGETSAERARRHNRVLKNNISLMAEDVDQLLNLDRMSHLAEKRVP
ncbi:MAG: hypothetical protein K9N55_04355 [Phycisphaerae bacterium]|nr:hypothetical protein [Phycisphaerae bacterium]